VGVFFNLNSSDFSHLFFVVKKSGINPEFFIKKLEFSKELKKNYFVQCGFFRNGEGKKL
jgi:hypothetical protein